MRLSACYTPACGYRSIRLSIVSRKRNLQTEHFVNGLFGRF